MQISERPTIALVTTRDQRATFGAKVRQLRERHGMSQAELGALLNTNGSTIASWEQGGGAKEDNVRALERIFGLIEGELGSILGQAPPPTMPSPEDAIKADTGIPAEHKRTLLAHLAEIRRLRAETDT